MASAARRLLPLAIATAIGIAILIALGTWQLNRLAWKEDLVARVNERMAAAPVAAPAKADWPGLDIDKWEYRRVRVAGVFDHGREARVYVNLPDPKGRFGGPGYFVLTPLRLADGSAVIVNRGFTPEPAADPAARKEGQVAGEVEIVGLLRQPEGRNMFTPPDDPAKRLFFARDPKAIAAGLGIDGAAPFTIDAEASAPGGLPQGGETRVSFPNRHLEYALTWYGLAGALFAVFLAVCRRTARERRTAD